MRTIMVRLHAADLAAAMAAMRRWLDDHRVQPRLFRYNKVGVGELVAKLDFAADPDAKAFAAAFCPQATPGWGGTRLMMAVKPYLAIRERAEGRTEAFPRSRTTGGAGKKPGETDEMKAIGSRRPGFFVAKRRAGLLDLPRRLPSVGILRPAGIQYYARSGPPIP